MRHTIQQQQFSFTEAFSDVFKAPAAPQAVKRSYPFAEPTIPVVAFSGYVLLEQDEGAGDVVVNAAGDAVLVDDAQSWLGE